MKKILFTVAFIAIALIISAQSKILAPELLFPADSAEGQMPDVTLDWSAVNGIGMVHYQLQYDDDPEFGNPEVVTTELSGFKTSQLILGHYYYWRVRAWDDTDTTAWTEPFTFMTIDQMESFKPDDGSTNQNVTVDIKWKETMAGESVTGFSYFHFQLALDSLFNDLYIDENLVAENVHVNGTDFVLTVDELLFGQEFFWRVRGLHELDTTQWSEVFSFSTKSQMILEEPANGTADLDLEVILVWEKITGSEEYIYQLDINQNFPDPITGFTESDSVTVSMLTFGKDYYWRTRAYHGADTSDWSEVRMFSTVAGVTPIEPENGDTVTLKPTFKWEGIAGVDSYVIHYDDNPGMSSPTEAIAGGGKTSLTLQFELENATMYYWSMAATANGDTSVWSNDRNFLSQSNIGLEENLFTNERVNVFPNPASDEVFINISGAGEFNVEFTVIDLLGQVIMRQDAMISESQRSHSLNVDQLVNGIYILRLNAGNSSYNTKLIVDK